MSYAVVGNSSVSRFKSNGTLKNGVLKAAPGILFAINCHNINAAAAYLRIYNQTGAPATSDTPVAEYVIPGATTGGVRDINLVDAYFSAGIAYRVVTGSADNGDTACASNEVVVTFNYK